jgi:hypothetical protein
VEKARFNIPKFQGDLSRIHKVLTPSTSRNYLSIFYDLLQRLRPQTTQR